MIAKIVRFGRVPPPSGILLDTRERLVTIKFRSSSIKVVHEKFAMLCVRQFASSKLACGIAESKLHDLKSYLGMPQEQALNVVSQEYALRRQAFTNIPSMQIVSAQKDTTGLHNFFHMVFVGGKLQAFSVATDWNAPPQPLPKNIHDSMVQKLGPPTNGAGTGSFVPTISRWVYDIQGHLLPDATPLTANCAGPEANLPGVNGIQKVDARCGISVELHVNQSNGYVPSTVVYVSNHASFNPIADELKGQADAKKKQEINKANQIKSPY